MLTCRTFHNRLCSCGATSPARLLFGSDYPLFSQRRALRNVEAALSVVEFDMVTGENAKRLLGL